MGSLLILTLFLIALRLAILAGTVALIVWVVKKVWYKNDEYKSNKNSTNSYRYRNKSQNFTYTEPKRYPSGWTFNEETKIWDPPEHLKTKPNTHKRIELTAEERRLANKIQVVRNEVTFEEWKAEQLRKELETAPRNQITEEGVYRYDYIHVPSEDIKHYYHTDTDIVVKRGVASQKPITEEKKQEPVQPVIQETVIELQTQEPEKEKTGYEEAYEAKPLLTYNESRNFRALQESAYKNGYLIQAKVRLADIVKPRNDEKYMSHFGKIKAKHVDFAICDDRMNVIAVVELDDSSHDREDRRKRDEFVDSILEANGIKVIHTRHITPDILDNL